MIEFYFNSHIISFWVFCGILCIILLALVLKNLNKVLYCYKNGMIKFYG